MVGAGRCTGAIDQGVHMRPLHALLDPILQQVIFGIASWLFGRAAGAALRHWRTRATGGSAPRCRLDEGKVALCRSRTRFRLRGLLILVDRPAYHTPAPYSDSTQVGHRSNSRSGGLSTALMPATLVIVREVLAQHGEQVACVVDQDPAQAIPPYRAEHLDALGRHS